MTRLPTPVQDGIVDFLDFLISLDDPDPDSAGRLARRTITLTQIIRRAQEVRDTIGHKVNVAKVKDRIPLAKIQERLGAITAPPWRAGTGRSGEIEVHAEVGPYGTRVAGFESSSFDSALNDAIFVAHAPQDILGLLDEVDYLATTISLQQDQATKEREVFRAAVESQVGRIRELEDTLARVRTALDLADADEALPFEEDDYQSGRAHAVHEVRCALEGASES